ncbi:MAG: GPR endopeptidase, partial [Clostridia bacterium]|nr:GPR endopeptidase [Clostridia bacterium]
TRHLQNGADGTRAPAFPSTAVAAVAPGVLAETGIETVELIRGAANTVRPDLLIAVDALAARSIERLATTVQLSDTGLNPGSGVGNRRKAIDRETVGCPVIALGVPTVVDSSTLVWDALYRAGFSESDLGSEITHVLESGRSYFVSPKEIDALTEYFSDLLAESIDRAFSEDFTTVG